MIPRILLISAVLFLLIHLPAGGPADIYAADPAASPESIERIRELWGLDRPPYIQYGQWLGNVLTGNWGSSYAERRPVTAIVGERLVNTLWLTAGALLFALVFGVGLGVIGAVSRLRRAVQGIAILGMSVPTFWSGTLVILVFAVYLNWLPTGGMATIGAPFSLTDRLWHLLAPAVVLGSYYVAQWSRYVQTGLNEVLAEDYIRTASAKGLRRLRIVFKHAMPNVGIPLITVFGLETPRILSGAMVTEVVFSWPGLGRLLTTSLLSRDYPVVMGTLMVFVVAVVIANLLADVAYGLADPRLRYE
jgi:peptide/nickel transport system permease protein